MKLTLLAVASVAAITIGVGTAAAQPQLIVPHRNHYHAVPTYSPPVYGGYGYPQSYPSGGYYASPGSSSFGGYSSGYGYGRGYSSPGYGYGGTWGGNHHHHHHGHHHHR